MRVQHICALAFVGLMAAGCALGRAPEPPKRIAVVKFKGAKAKKLQHIVADMVGKHHDLVSYKQYSRAARKLGARRMQAKHVRRVAAELSIDAVVEGKLVRRSRRSYTLKLLVREGVTGKTIQTYSIPVRKRRISESNQRKLEDKLLDLIAEIEPIARDDEGDEEEVERPRHHSKRSRHAKRSKRSRRRHAREPRDEEPDEPADEIDQELERDPVVFKDEVDENGQFVDDEVPDALQ